MTTATLNRASGFQRAFNKFKTYISKPQNAILLMLGIILTITTIFPMYTILRDTVKIHPGSIDTQEQAIESQTNALGTTLTTYNWTNLFAGTESVQGKSEDIWTPAPIEEISVADGRWQSVAATMAAMPPRGRGG